MLSGIAEFERELILGRTNEGRARAPADGMQFGRKPKLTAHQRREAFKRLDAGQTTREIALSYNVAHTAIARLKPAEAAQDPACSGSERASDPIPDGQLTGLKTTAPDVTVRARRPRACRYRAFVRDGSSSAPAIDHARAPNRSVAPRTTAVCGSSWAEVGKDDREQNCK